MIQNQITKFSEDSFKYILIRFNKDDNDIITMDEFCHAIFPSDFLSDNTNQNEKIQNPYLRYVKGDEQDFQEFITGTNRVYEDQDKFNQEDYVFHNDVDTYYEQKVRQGFQQPRKFLKTSMCYDNSLNFRPMSSAEYQNVKDKYPTLDRYLIKNYQQKKYRFKDSLVPQKILANPRSQSANNFYHENMPNNHFQSQNDLQQSIDSPINQISSQKKLFLDYDNFNQHNKGQMNDYLDSYIQSNQIQYHKNHQKPPGQLKKEHQNGLVKSLPSAMKSTGIYSSTAKSQYVGERIQPFRPQDFTKSRFEY